MKLTSAGLRDAAQAPDAPVWAVVGAEDLARRQAMEAIASLYLDPALAEFDHDRLEGESLDAGRVLGAWQTIPLASRRRVVTVSGAEEAPPAELQKLTRSLSTPCERGCLILELRSDEGKEVRALLKAVDEAGVVVNCAAAGADDARAFLQEAAAREGVRLEAAAAEEMRRRLGNDLWQLESELRKLADHVWPEKTIGRQHVDRLIPAPPEDRVFAMIDAVCEGSAGEALRMLRDLFALAEDERSAAHRTLALLARHFRLLWQARGLRDAGFTFQRASALPPAAEKILLPAPNLQDVLKRQPFLMSKFAAQSRRFGLRRLAAVFEILAETDLALKGYAPSAGSPRADLEMCLTRIAMAARSSTAKRPGPA